jgi:hypothetical protein
VSDEVLSATSNDASGVNLACHALVFMIRGLTSNWKQVVAYYLTGMSVSGNQMWELTRNVIVSLAKLDINVRAVVSDMGAANRAMWKVAGIAAGRTCLKSSISHPFFPNQDLYFLADVPHLLKNIRNCLLKQNVILPREVVNEFGLPSSEVSISHVRKLVELQENSDFKIAPSLSKKHVDPKQFEKMKVNVAAQLLSHSTASALRFAVQANLLPAAALTTAWFAETINNWFDAANARNRKEALYAKSGSKIQSLLFLLDMVPKLNFVGSRNCSWKPIQTGILISTQSLLDIFASLVASGSYSYLLTSRLTQDALENLFSQIRGRGNSHPNPVHFRQCLRLISISQFLSVPKHSSYSSSECDFAVDLLKRKTLPDGQLAVSIIDDVPAVSDVEQVDASLPTFDTSVASNTETTDDILNLLGSSNLTSSESNALCYLTGWIAFKLKNDLQSCNNCIAFLVSNDPMDKNMPQTQLTVIKSYGWLTIPSQSLQKFVLAAEDLFQQNQSECLSSTDALELMMNRSAHLLKNSVFSIPHCHDVGRLVLKKFFRLRSHICARSFSKSSKEEQQHGSKSAKARTTIK